MLLAMGLLSSSCLTKDLKNADRLDPAVTGQIPDHWTAARIRVPEGAATNWLSDFNSSKLVELSQEAVAGNYDLAASTARIKSAVARARDAVAVSDALAAGAGLGEARALVQGRVVRRRGRSIVDGRPC